jgi:hypothetical protein
MRPTTLITVLLLAATVLGGCGQSDVGYMVQMVGGLFSPPAKTKPVLSLEDKDVLLVVDVARRELATDHPRLALLVSEAVVRELRTKNAARRLVEPNELAAYARSHANEFSQIPLVELGRQFKADLVIHLVIENYRLDPSAGTDSFAAAATVSLRVIDVAKGVQVYPELEGETEVEVRSAAGITAVSHQGAEKVLLDGLALKIAQLFVAYEVEKLPSHPEVQ